MKERKWRKNEWKRRKTIIRAIGRMKKRKWRNNEKEERMKSVKKILREKEKYKNTKTKEKRMKSVDRNEVKVWKNENYGRIRNTKAIKW